VTAKGLPLSTAAVERAKPGVQTGKRSRARAFLAISAFVGVVAFLYVEDLARIRAAGGDRWGLWPFVALGVWACDAYPVRIRNRKVSMSMGLSEVPILVGVVFLKPGLTLAAVSCGYVAANAHQRRPVMKTLVHSAIYVAAVAAGIAVYYDWLGRASPVGEHGWLVSAGTVALIAVTNLVLVIVVMAVVDARYRRLPAVRISIQAGIYIGICAAGALVAISLVWVNTWGIALFVAIAVATNFAYRATVTSGQRYANLEKLYDFTRHMSGLTEGRDVMAQVLEESRALLLASRAELVVPLERPLEKLALRCSLEGDGDPGFEDGVPLSRLDAVAACRGPVLLEARSEDPEVASVMKERGLREALIAPLQREEPGAGYLLVADRAFQHEGFKPSDLRFFETLAANAGVALRSSELLEQLRREVAVRQHQAYHDTLTGLPNRVMFTERLAQALAAGGPGRVAAMFIDLDGFKEVNDTLGHVTGDAILREVANRLTPYSRQDDLVARLGGDEFALLLAGAEDELDVEAAADQVLATVTRPMAVEGLLLDVRASIGVAVSPERGRYRDATNLMRHADVAMYLAKASGGGVRFYDPAEDRSTLRRLTLATELRQAIEREGLEVWYQPVVKLRTGEVLGCEALLRWSHDQFGPIAPVEFIPVAESAGLIDPLTWWVLDQALAQLASWREFLPGLSVAVNLSARSLTSPRVPERVERSLLRSGLAPEALTLELTESSMMADPEVSHRAMHHLRELGVNLSIDDYGTGFSSLSRLKDLPFKELKIDRSFVKEMTHDKGDEAIVRSTIELARNLGRTVTAEGVEDKDTLDELARLGCHAAQGYYLARPLPATECETWLTAFTLWPSTITPLGTRHGHRRAAHEVVARHNMPEVAEA
jgi:diguanylate cyclase (GGDEF)-like protein